ncbi:MAG: hypothetical protein QOG77_2326, partial [Solirubrobacteraceae bacterium]|nr:hypothetical protein [Solirubrobacteraceae bacterium]
GSAVGLKPVTRGGYGPHVIHPWTVRAVRYAMTDPAAELGA